jgi:hypothetical protein
MLKLLPLASVVQFSKFPIKDLIKKSSVIRQISISVFCNQKEKEKEKVVWGTKKKHRQVKLNLTALANMADPKIEEILAPLRQEVKEQVSFPGMIFWG